MPPSRDTKLHGLLNMFRVAPQSWVMLDENKNFVPLPKEKVLFTSPLRTTLTLQTPNSYPGKTLHISSNSGVAFLTNQRLVYLPTTPDPTMQSFMAPILNLQDARVTAPFFGPNVWMGILKPVTGGGIPAQHAFVEIKMTFKEGGAFDFHSTYERIRDSLLRAVENAQASGHELDMANVHLDELPAYTEAGGTSLVSSNRDAAPPAGRGQQSGSSAVPSGARTGDGASSERFEPPSEPPPGYEEAQSSGVRDRMEESIRRAS